jgi:hypothetical protein
VVIIGNLVGSGAGVILALSFLSALVTFLSLQACDEFEIKGKYLIHCFLSSWLLIFLADITLLPIVGAVWFLKEIKKRITLFVRIQKGN